MAMPGPLSVRDMSIIILRRVDNSSDNINDSKVVDDVNILPEVTNIVENTLVDFGTPIIDEVYRSFDSTNNDLDEIVKFTIPAVLVRSFEFP